MSVSLSVLSVNLQCVFVSVSVSVCLCYSRFNVCALPKFPLSLSVSVSKCQLYYSRSLLLKHVYCTAVKSKLRCKCLKIQCNTMTV